MYAVVTTLLVLIVLHVVAKWAVGGRINMTRFFVWLLGTMLILFVMFPAIYHDAAKQYLHLTNWIVSKLTHTAQDPDPAHSPIAVITAAGGVLIAFAVAALDVWFNLRRPPVAPRQPHPASTTSTSTSPVE